MNNQECIIRTIPVQNIRIVNSRKRDKRKYGEIVESIQTLGLKTPIVVTPRRSQEDNMEYDLICGEGRLNAFKNAGEQEIPARVVSTSREDALLMGLVENIARRQANKISLIKEVNRLSKEGYNGREIARKVGKTEFYISQLNALMKKGRPEIVNAVLTEKMNFSTAFRIVSCSDDQEIQKEINDAYESGEIKAKDLKLIQNFLSTQKQNARKKTKAGSVISEFNKRVKYSKNIIRKVDSCEMTLAFLKGAFTVMFQDEGFIALLECQGIVDIPSQLQ